MSSQSTFRGLLDTETVPLYWRVERLVWIGFSKNVDNNVCIFGKLPKDIIGKTLAFLRITNAPKLLCKIDDRIKLLDGKTGLVKFIGHTNFTNDIAVGLELESWNPNSSDGTINNVKIFDCEAGRAFFLTRMQTHEMNKSSIYEGCYARLKELQKVPQFNGKTVKVISFVVRKGRWKVKLISNDRDRKFLGVREINLRPILDWEFHPDSLNGGIRKMPDVDDCIKLRDGSLAIVKYCGSTMFSPEECLGVERQHWSPNATDGRVQGVKYFIAPQGTAYFTNMSYVLENYKKIEIGDYVELKSGDCGTVKYVTQGWGQDPLHPEISSFQQPIGIELDIGTSSKPIPVSVGFEAKEGKWHVTDRQSILKVHSQRSSEKQP